MNSEKDAFWDKHYLDRDSASDTALDYDVEISSGDGWYHQGPPEDEARELPDGQGNLRDSLFIFIHGILTDASWWEHKAPNFFQCIGIESDAFAFQYPVKPFVPYSNARAARNLIYAIKKIEAIRGKRYKHLFLVCHSNGGLVAREFLVRETTRLIKLFPDSSHLNQDRIPTRDELPSYARRTRAVFEFAVPVFGGSVVHSLLSLLMFVIQVLCYFPILWLLRLVSQDKWNFGINWISLSLSPFGTRSLRKRLHQCKEFCEANSFPFPFGVSLVGDLDSIAWTERTSSIGYCKLREKCSEENELCKTNHSTESDHSVDILNKPTSLVWLKDSLSKLRDKFFVDASLRQFDLTYDACRQKGVSSLLGMKGVSRSKGEQREVHRFLLESIERSHGSERLFLLISPMGSGKSRLISFLVRSLACNYLSCSNREISPGVLLFSLQLFGLPEKSADTRTVVGASDQARRLKDAAKSSSRDLGNELVEMWSRISTRVSGNKTLYTSEQLDRALSRKRTVIVVDAVDEFCNVFGLSVDVVIEAFESLRDRYDKNHSLVMAIRSTARGLSFATERRKFQRTEISELSMDSKAQFGATDTELYLDDNESINQDLPNPLQTPFFVSLQSRSHSNSANSIAQQFAQAKSAGEKLSVAAQIKLQEELKYSKDDVPTIISELAIVSQSFTQNWITASDSTAIHQTLMEMASDSRRSEGSPPFEVPSKSRIEQILPGFFQETGEDTWSWSHETWRTFLSARFFADRLVEGNTIAISGYGFSPLETALAMDLVMSEAIDGVFVSQVPDMIEQCARLSSDSRQLYALGNLVAAAVWSKHGEFSGDSATKWLGLLEPLMESQYSVVCQVFLLNAIMFRIQLSLAKSSLRNVPPREVDRFQELCLRRAEEMQSPILRAHSALVADQLFSTHTYEYPTSADYFESLNSEFERKPGFDPNDQAQVQSMQRSFVMLLDDPKSGKTFFQFRRIASAFYLSFLFELFQRGLCTTEAEAVLEWKTNNTDPMFKEFQANAQGTPDGKFLFGLVEHMGQQLRRQR